jgi:hypothetical protein
MDDAFECVVLLISMEDRPRVPIPLLESYICTRTKKPACIEVQANCIDLVCSIRSMFLLGPLRSAYMCVLVMLEYCFVHPLDPYPPCMAGSFPLRASLIIL